ncbi:MAG: hypothetical protein GX451_11890 [Acholeplasmataceae bacterium]|nr:hypothetical protein [Acholeplasmataceae bacterium]
MDLNNISLTTVLASGVVSAIISSTFGLWQKKIDYRQGYYKAVLDKRMEQYEKVQNIISDFVIYRIDGSEASEEKHIFYYKTISTSEGLSTIYNKITDCAQYKIWMSKSLVEHLMELGSLLRKCGNADKDVFFLNIKSEHENITRAIKNIENAFKNDLLELYDVPKFLHEAKHQKWVHKKISHIPIVRNWIN